jgi:hypothetical protein
MPRAIHRSESASIIAGCIAAALIATASVVWAQSTDGTYNGTISCGVLSNLTQPLRTQFTMNVSVNEATYERPILRPSRSGGQAERTGSSEPGVEPFSSNGEVVLNGDCGGEFNCEGHYEGKLNTTPIHLSGTQRWLVRGKAELRTCEIELVHTPAK